MTDPRDTMDHLSARLWTEPAAPREWERADYRTDERGRRRLPVRPDEDLDGERDTGPVDPWVEALR